VVAPDAGRVRVCERWTDRLGCPLAIIHKRRDPDVANQVKVLEVVGKVQGRTCILVDDMVDTGATIVNAAEALFEQGADQVIVTATHGVLSGGAVARITASRLKELVITDSIQPTQAVRVAHNIRVLSVASLIGEAIGRTAAEESVSSLFD
jgi:ribose-phosphate pyrophosphokinase